MIHYNLLLYCTSIYYYAVFASSVVCSACAVCVAVVVEVVGRWTGSFCLYHQHRGIISLAQLMKIVIIVMVVMVVMIVVGAINVKCSKRYLTSQHSW